MFELPLEIDSRSVSYMKAVTRKKVVGTLSNAEITKILLLNQIQRQERREGYSAAAAVVYRLPESFFH